MHAISQIIFAMLNPLTDQRMYIELLVIKYYPICLQKYSPFVAILNKSKSEYRIHQPRLKSRHFLLHWSIHCNVCCQNKLIAWQSNHQTQMIYITKPLVTNYIKCFRWCLDMLVRLRLKKKQCHTCLVNHEPQFVFMWVLVKTAVQLQKMKSNYTLLFMRFSSLSSPIILQLLSQLSSVPISISQR